MRYIYDCETKQTTTVEETADELDEREQVHLSILASQLKAESLAYLASTDWYVVRFSETGVAIPDDIKKLRQQARDAIV